MRRVPAKLLLLLLTMLAACSTRSMYTGVAEPNAHLTEGGASRLIRVWQDEVRRYIDREGDGNPAVLSQTGALHSRAILRPGRITFGVLDAESGFPGRNGWDVQGVLIGKQASGVHNWYVFLVGIVQRTDYRPTVVEDIRVVALWTQAGKITWETSAPDPPAVQRYRDAFAGSNPVRFPADIDRFSMTLSGSRLCVHEAQSGADWSLPLADEHDGGGD